MQIKDITNYLETMAPLSYQESYDNSGLITGDPKTEVRGILVTLDCIEKVVEEAIETGANLIVAHHPILFGSLKRITGENYVERTLLKAIRNHIGIYALHTNLDNVSTGVNKKICDKIGLIKPKILAPKSDSLTKLTTFIPKKDLSRVLDALYEAGAGSMENYSHCSFQVEGSGTFLPHTDANPHIGTVNQLETVEETRVEVVLPSFLEEKIIIALKSSHPYEVPAYYLTKLKNNNAGVGAGMIGELPVPLDPLEFLDHLKICMNLQVIRHTAIPEKKVKRIAVCGGAGSFLLPLAKKAGADVFVSADFKYHEFFDADNQVIIADIGHYESEIYTKDLIIEHLMKKFPTFAINFSKTVTNPISYL